jgi:hypothetical protein
VEETTYFIAPQSDKLEFYKFIEVTCRNVAGGF